MTCVGKVQINFLNWKIILFCQVEPSGNSLSSFIMHCNFSSSQFSLTHLALTNEKPRLSTADLEVYFFIHNFFFFTLNLSFLPVRGKQAQLKHEERKEKSCKLNSFAQHRANKKNERKRLNCIYLQFCSILFLLPPPPPLSFVLFTCHSHFTCWHFTAMVQNWKFIFFISLARSLTHIQHL